MEKKFIFVTGGVVSSLGKGLASASIGCLLESRGFTVSLLKFDPYLNVDPGTMSPYQHGEVYVTDDGAETDLDLGHYERYTHAELTRKNNLTTGRLDYPIAPEIERGDERALAFIEHHFGAIWSFECARALRNDPPTLFVIEHAGRIVAFSAHEANNRGLGTFGPVGVAMDHRGRGLGRMLLQASLADLRRLGYERAIIPWTGAIDFYEKSCGARVEQRLVIMVR